MTLILKLGCAIPLVASKAAKNPLAAPLESEVDRANILNSGS